MIVAHGDCDVRVLFGTRTNEVQELAVVRGAKYGLHHRVACQSELDVLTRVEQIGRKRSLHIVGTDSDVAVLFVVLPDLIDVHEHGLIRTAGVQAPEFDKVVETRRTRGQYTACFVELAD